MNFTAAIVPLNQPWPKGKIVERKGFSWNLRNHNYQRSRIYIWHLYNFNHYMYTRCVYFEFVTLMILAQGLHNRGSPLLHDPNFQCLHLWNLGSTFPNVSWWRCLGLLAHDGATIQLCFRSSQLGIKACFVLILHWIWKIICSHGQCQLGMYHPNNPFRFIQFQFPLTQFLLRLMVEHVGWCSLPTASCSSPSSASLSLSTQRMSSTPFGEVTAH